MNKFKGLTTVKVDNDVSEFLICSQCRQVPISVEELLQCINGDLICAECFPKTEKCSECQVAVKKYGKIKCAELTKTLILEIPAACPYVTEGCSERCMPRADLKAHLEKCPFKNEKDEKDTGSGDQGRTVVKEETRIEDGVVFTVLGNEVDIKQEDLQPSAIRLRNSASAATAGAEASDLPRKGDIFTGGIGDYVYPKCDECHKSFVNQAVLVNHKNRCHAAELVFFRCGFCGKNLRAKTSVAHHIAALHHEGTNEKDGENGFFCPFCAAKFGKKETLGKHIIQSHMDAIQ